MSARIYAHPQLGARDLHQRHATHGLQARPFQGRTPRHRWYLLIELVREGGTPLRRAG
ncbi:MAG: hypothetical protein ACK5X3_01400 [Pseudomonadota bacterium]